MSKPPRKIDRNQPQRQIEQVLVHQQAVRKFSGPLPPPEVVEHYERVHPGAAGVILGMAQKEQDSRLAINSENSKEAVAYAQRGQWMAFSLALVAMGIGALVAHLGHPVVAGTIFGSVVLGVVGAFLAPRLAKKDPPK